MVKKLLKILRAWRFSYAPLLEITVSKDRLLHNLRLFQSHNAGIGIAPVLKANGYGHGLTLVAKIVDKEKIPFIVVDSYHEAMILRNERIKSAILIIGYSALDNILKNKLDRVAFTVVGLEQLEEISKNLAAPARFHVKIDTGMHRQGLLPEDMNRAMALIRANPSIVVEGVCSHLADADNETADFTNKQIKVWNDSAETWKKEFPSVKYFHLSATSGSTYSKKIAANVLRLGIGLYGVDPTKNARLPNLKPALQMTSVISGVKNLKKGDRVGYNGTFEAPRAMSVATIPAGYYEGVDRRLGNLGFVKVAGIFCPIVGRVSMNITTIDVTDIPEVREKTPVVIISSNPSDKNSLAESARLAGTIPYELMVRIPQGLRRKVV